MLMKLMPSTAPVVEKAQHEPHWPWFFGGVTAPSSTQSISGGGATSLNRKFSAVTEPGGFAFSRRSGRYPSILLNSSEVRSASRFAATQCECTPAACSALWASMNARFSAKTPRRIARSAASA